MMLTPDTFVNSMPGLMKVVGNICIKKDSDSYLITFISKEIDTRCGI